MTPLLTALATLVTAVNAIAGTPNATALAAPAAVDPSGALSTAVTTAATALTLLLTASQLPMSGVGFSTNVSSS
jgi:hypothetical protein